MMGLLMVLREASLCMYLLVRMALRSSLRWASATYSGLVAMILPFISVTAFVASSGEEKQTKPKPLLWEPSVITCGRQRSGVEVYPCAGWRRSPLIMTVPWHWWWCRKGQTPFVVSRHRCCHPGSSRTDSPPELREKVNVLQNHPVVQSNGCNSWS